MPGILYHLSFASKVYRELENVINLDKITFYSGNLIPDLAVDKLKSHYRQEASLEGFYVPDLKQVKKELLDINDDLKLGMYAHLYLDYYFIEKFLIPEFVWDKENMQVINPRNNMSWDVKTFFSQKGMYGAYTEINQLIISNSHFSLDEVNQIPELLPLTSIEVFDDRRDKTWKKELDEYIKQKKEYTGQIFDYNRLIKSIESIANNFVKEVKETLN